MALPNTEKLTSQLSMMPDPALKRMAMMYKNDPYIFPLVIAEDGRRKQVRTAGAAAQAQPQPKVADQEIAQMAGMPENVGIGQLPAPNLARMASGGIVAFEEGGEVERFQAGGMSRELAELVLQTAAKYNIDPNIAMRLVKQESGFDPNAVSKRGAVGLTQLMPDAAEEMGLSKDERTDPAKNVNAGLAYLRKQLDKYGNDYSKALAAYNWGSGNVDKHLAKNEGAINPVGLPKETANYLTKILPGGSAMAAEPRKPDMRGVPTPIDTKAKPAPAAAPQERSQFQAMADAARGVLGAGETALQYGTGLLSIPTAGAYAQYRRAMYGDDPEKVFKEASGSVTYAPRTESGQAMSERFGRTLEDLKIPGYMPGVGPRAPKGTGKVGVPAAELAEFAAEKTRQAETPRLMNEVGGRSDTMVQKPGQAPVKAGELVRKQLEDIEAAKALTATAEAAKKTENLGLADLAAEQAKINQRARLVGAGATTPSVVAGQAAGAGSDTGGGVPSVAPENYDPIGAAYQQQGEKKGSVDQELVKALSESKAKESGGLAGLFNDPMFLLGARLMAGKSQYALQNLGEAGIGTASDLMAQRKADVEGKYYGALAKRAEALAKTEGLTGPTQLAYFFGKGDTPEERVRTGYPLIQAMNNQMKALELDADVQKLYWTYAAEAVKSGQPPMQPKEWAQYNRTITAFNRPTFESRIGSGDERLPR